MVTTNVPGNDNNKCMTTWKDNMITTDLVTVLSECINSEILML